MSFHVQTENSWLSENNNKGARWSPRSHIHFHTYLPSPSVQQHHIQTNMADPAITAQSSPYSDANMDINTAGLTAYQRSSSAEESERVKIVCLSGPIKIIVPLSPLEEMEILWREQIALLFSDAPTYTEISPYAINNNVSETGQLSQPTDIRSTIQEMGDITHTGPGSNSQTPKWLSSITEKSAAIVKKSDPDHPEEKSSPL
jgi:hypothetical protein